MAAQERFDEALEAFAQAQERWPQAPGVFLHQGLTLAELGRWEEAVASLQQAMLLRPGNAVFMMFLGQIFFDQGDYINARTWCERALAIQPYNNYAVALHALIELACHHMVSGYQELTQPLPQPLAFLERAFLWLARGQVPTVLAQSNHAIQSRLLLVVESYLLRHGTLAQTLSQQLVQLFADEEPGWLGRFYQWLSGGVLALRRLGAYGRYLGRPQVRAAALLQLQAEHMITRGQFSAAVALYKQFLEQGTDRLDIHEQLFELCYAQGAFQEALVHLRHVVGQNAATNGHGAIQALLLGELLYIDGHYAQALTHLSRAHSLQLQDYKLSYYLALCQLREGARQQARRTLRQTVQLLNPAFDPDITALRLQEMSRVYLLVSGGDG